MPHDHHHCECDHDRVKYCKKCAVVHCLDCKQEWTFTPCQRPHGWYQSLGQYSVSYPSISTYVTASGQGAPSTITAECEH